MKAHKPDDRVRLIIKDSPSQNRNVLEKELFTKLIKTAAIGMHKNFGNTSQMCKDNTTEFMVKISENLDSRTFTVFNKHLNELKASLDIDEEQNRLSPDSFLIFLDKIKEISFSTKVNEVILRKIANVSVDMMKTKSMLNTYQKHSTDFKFE